MTTEIENIRSLFQSAERIVNHQEEIKKLRGENFNVFSILRMESKENATHSAFLGELLNPKGSHFQGKLFLDLFLQTIEYTKLEIDTTTLILEKSVGTRDDKEKTGGRIDIYLIDAKGNSISIENKIYAIDQFAQIQRYINHNKGRNTVYYLTLDGKPASSESKGSLEDGKDYFCISYKQTILTWLTKCLRETVEQPILRESIRQYIILIKKLTNQLTDTKMEREIRDLIAKNYLISKLIEANVWDIELKSAHAFLIEVKEQFENALKDGWTFSVDDDLNQSLTGARITHKDWDGIFIKVEGGNKVPWAISWYGLFAPEDSYDHALIYKKLANTPSIKEDYRNSKVWPWYKGLMSFATDEERSRLFDPTKRAELLKDVSSRLIDLAKECQLPLSSVKKIRS